MSVEPFRRDVARTRPDSICRRINIYTYELNLLMRLAHTYGIPTHVDLVDRDNYTEIVVHHDGS